MTRIARETWNGADPAPATRKAAPRDGAPDLPPFEEALSIIRAHERDLSARNMVPLWAELYEHYPGSPLALRMMVRAFERAGDHAQALEILAGMPEAADDAQAYLRTAECISELRQRHRALPLFRELLAKDPRNPRLLSVIGKYLKTKGDLLGAFDILSRIETGKRSDAAAALLHEVDDTLAAVEELSPGLAADLPDPARVLTRALESFATRPITPLRKNDVGGITLYTGSLGAGGAERQMTRIASALQARRSVGCPVGGHNILGNVDVLVNALDPDKKKDFFKPDLEMAGVPVTVVRDLPLTPEAEIAQAAGPLARIVGLLPSHPRFGIERLVGHLRRTRPEILYIWQDGAVLTGALAALIAGVPRIAISLRGLPPVMRPHLMKPEYPGMFRALAQIPGVSLSCNSGAAAAAYAKWLELPPETFSVIYNAHLPLSCEPDSQARDLWRAFEATTEEADITVGGVFRFNANKRPLFWLECAKEALSALPNLRFVLVGDGEDRKAAEKAAHQMGIAHRVLFVGHSKSVGFWLSKMDAVVHLARNEGLPNVLIEAQAQGLPVVATPAGGSAETFVDGASGILLASAEDPSRDLVTCALQRLFENPKRRARMGAIAQRVAEDRFNMERVLNRTFRFFGGEYVGPNPVTCAKAPTDQTLRADARFSQGGATAYNLFQE